jgi:hypothetical protein
LRFLQSPRGARAIARAASTFTWHADRALFVSSSAIERSGPIASVVEVVDLEDPTQAGPFALRIQAPAGYTVPPRWHPTTENLTVLSGAVAIGMDDKTDIAAMTTLPAGGFVVLPAEMRHVFVARTAATIQIHGMGPFAITYVNPADDPRQKK